MQAGPFGYSEGFPNIFKMRVRVMMARRREKMRVLQNSITNAGQTALVLSNSCRFWT